MVTLYSAASCSRAKTSRLSASMQMDASWVSAMRPVFDKCSARSSPKDDSSSLDFFHGSSRVITAVLTELCQFINSLSTLGLNPSNETTAVRLVEAGWTADS